MRMKHKQENFWKEQIRLDLVEIKLHLKKQQQQQQTKHNSCTYNNKDI